MEKIESMILKVMVWFIPPFLLFVLFWWIAASLSLSHIIKIPDTFIAISAFTGLLFGLIFVMIAHKYLYKNFYNFPYRYLILLYILLSSIALAFMMGVPICIFILGIFAGIYIGRRSHYSEERKKSIFKRAGLFTSCVTGFWTLIIGVLALIDGEVNPLIERVTGLPERLILGPIGFAMIMLLTIMFGSIQFYCTLFSCKLSYKKK